MSKLNLKKAFLEELRKIPIVQTACDRSGISRQTFYRWKSKSKTFSAEVEKAMQEGINFVNDMSEAQLLNMIKDENFSALSLWLRHRHSAYKQKIEVTTVTPNEELTPEQKELVKNALQLANFSKSTEENKKPNDE